MHNVMRTRDIHNLLLLLLLYTTYPRMQEVETARQHNTYNVYNMQGTSLQIISMAHIDRTDVWTWCAVEVRKDLRTSDETVFRRRLEGGGGSSGITLILRRLVRGNHGPPVFFRSMLKNYIQIGKIQRSMNFLHVKRRRCVSNRRHV